MKPKNKKQLGANEPVEEDHGTITYLSETEWVTTYRDGTTVHGTQNRPNNQADVRWMFRMIHDLAAHSAPPTVLNQETAA